MQKVEGSSPFSRFREVLAPRPFRALQLAPSAQLGGLLSLGVPIGCQDTPAGSSVKASGDVIAATRLLDLVGIDPDEGTVVVALDVVRLTWITAGAIAAK